MRKRVKLLAVLCLLVMVAITFVGCGANLDYLYYTDDANYYYEVRLTLPNELVDEIDASATAQWGYDPKSKMSLHAWLTVFSEMIGYDMDAFSTEEPDSIGYRFLRVVPFEDVEDDDDDDDDDTVVEVDNLFYLYRVNVTIPHPFNDMKKEFLAPESDTSLMGVIRNGYEELPALMDAFPAIKEEDLEKLTCSFLMEAINGGESSGETVTVNIRLPGDPENYKVDFFKFTRNFDDEELYITYSYYRSNSLGWYITIILIGVAVVGLILLFTYKKKDNKPAMQDVFPYDPGKSDSGSESSLPTGYNGDGSSQGGTPFDHGDFKY